MRILLVALILTGCEAHHAMTLAKAGYQLHQARKQRGPACECTPPPTATATPLPVATQTPSPTATPIPVETIEAILEGVYKWPNWLIYKTEGSHEFADSDPRKTTLSLIGRKGAPVRVGECLELVDSADNVVARLGRYYPDGDWAFRMYSGWGCGKKETAKQIAKTAKGNTGRRVIFARIGKAKLGPIDPLKCKNSSQC